MATHLMFAPLPHSGRSRSSLRGLPDHSTVSQNPSVPLLLRALTGDGLAAATVNVPVASFLSRSSNGA